MKKLTFIVVIILIVACFFPLSVFAVDVTSLTFSIMTSAPQSTPNLRVTVMKRVLRNDKNTIPIQGFALQSDSTFNYYLTKNTSFPITADYIAIQIGVDQDTKVKVNAETAYKVIQAGETRTFVLK